MQSLRNRMARGAVWMVLFKALERSLGLISMLILARLLIPADFGLVGLAKTLIPLKDQFIAIGLDTALIQRAEVTPAHFNSAWTLNVIAGATIAALMLVLAWPASYFYREPRLPAVICVLAAGAAIQGFENVGVVMFRKDMRFDRSSQARLLDASRVSR
jgi:lipopolysaccharide exporter